MSNPTTYDMHREHLIVPYVEAIRSTIPTTHDLVTARLTVEFAPVPISDVEPA